MELIGKYYLHEHKEPETAVKDFSWQVGERQAILEWKWPTDSRVKLMLVFTIDVTAEGEGADITVFLRQSREHTVVSRKLANTFQAALESDVQRYMICPAYFNDDNKVIVYKPVYITDLIYKKQRIRARAEYKPLQMSRYKQATLNIDSAIGIDTVLRYGIYENNRLVGIYPVDNDIIQGNYTIYIPKNQEVRFFVDDDYVNLFEVEGR